MLDPQSVEAQSVLAGALTGRVLDQMSDAVAADIARAEELVGQALAASPRSPLAHHAKGQVLRAQRRWAEALPEYETAFASDHNWLGALNAIAYCKFYTGSLDDVIPLMEQAIRLSPRDPQIGLFYHQIGRVHLLQSRVGEAIPWLERARNAIPEATYISLHARFSIWPPRRARTRRRRTCGIAAASRLKPNNSSYEGQRVSRRTRGTGPHMRSLFSLGCATPEFRRNDRISAYEYGKNLEKLTKI